MKILETELIKISSMNYNELVHFLKMKYGDINESYFANENCKTINQRIKRTADGLFIHHIAENQYIELSNSKYAIQAPFEYQLGKKLVYCNYWEHLFLHICIVKEFLNIDFVKKTKMVVGIGGLVNFILPEIIDYINGYDYKRDYMKTALSAIDGYETFFIKTLFEFQKLISKEKYLEIMFGTYRRIPDVFKGKMTSKGRFFDLVAEYAFKEGLFKFVTPDDVYLYIDSIKQKGAQKINVIHHGMNKGDSSVITIAYYSKTKKFFSKDFRVFPCNEDQINLYINNKI